MNKKIYIVIAGVAVVLAGVYVVNGFFGKSDQDDAGTLSSSEISQRIQDADIRGRFVSVDENFLRIAQSENTTQTTLTEAEREKRRADMQRMSEEERAKAREARQKEQASMPQREIIVSFDVDTRFLQLDANGNETTVSASDIPQNAGLDIVMNDTGDVAQIVVIRTRENY